MRIKKIRLQNFKRFTDLTIDNIPESSKLVLLIGSNGSGKSSVFDAFNIFNANLKKDHNYKSTAKYFSKFDSNKTEHKIDYLLHDRVLNSNSFYGRTSFRQVPRLTRTSLGQTKFDTSKDTDRPKFFIDRDERFENDLDSLIRKTVSALFQEDFTSQELRNRITNPINDAFERIFGTKNGTLLKVKNFLPPADGNSIEITFQKGEAEFGYNLLSAGEKEVFNILLNLLSRSENYQNTIYYYDEIDLHLNTKIQFNLLKELTENWIPENSQLWTASHSLGFIEYAKKSEHASIIDFDDFDFDQAMTLVPIPKENHNNYEIAVPKEMLSSIFQDKDIYFVENNDVDYYNQLSSNSRIFVKGADKNDVYFKVVKDNQKGIIDRDFVSENDTELIREYYPNLVILDFYSIENYLYHPENLKEYYNIVQKEFNKDEYKNQIFIEKEKIVDHLAIEIKTIRNGYKFFKEQEFKNKELRKRFEPKSENTDQTSLILKDLKSEYFEHYYKFIPMKDYCTQIEQRLHIDKINLSKTDWFKTNISKLLKKI